MLAAVWVLGEEWLWNQFTVLLARLAQLAGLRRLEAVIARQHQYVLLALFAVPLVLMVPFKLYSFYLIGTGRAYRGLMVLVTAKVLGTALVTRLYVIGQDKLLAIAWFASLHHWVLAKKQWLHDELHQLAWLEEARQIARQALDYLKTKIAAWRGRTGGAWERLRLFRDFLKKREQRRR